MLTTYSRIKAPQMIDITSISAIVTTASIIVGIIFTILEIRHFTATRKKKS